MKGFPWYSAEPGEEATAPADLPRSRRRQAADPRRYVPTSDLVDAVNTALLLGQPLLVTGEPGTGKTLLAPSIAWQLGLGEALRFDVKSTSKAKDLFYTFDALGRFQAAQTQTADRGALPYLTWGPLGLAILKASTPESTGDLLLGGARHARAQRSVVLVDEVDKAPRDFPNDILNELEDLSFRVPELENRRVEAPAELQPIVVFTSNSEKTLPDAFLRRCVYHDIRFPERERLREILAAQLGGALGGEPFLARVLEVFDRLRDPGLGLKKRPATAELIAWIVALHGFAAGRDPLSTFSAAARRTLGVLVKNPEDRDAAERTLQDLGV
jgi:MoxR-like ATPase